MILLRALRLVVEVAVAELIELQVAVLVVDVQTDGLQHVEQQRLPHDVQVGAQRIDDAHAALRRAGGETFVVGRLRQRVGHDLREAVVGQEICRKVHELAAVGFRRIGERRTHARRNFDIIVSVDAENILDQVGLALHVDAVGRHGNGQAPLVLGEDLHLEGRQDRAHGLLGNLLADERIDARERDVEDEIGSRNGTDVRDLARDGAAGQLLHQLRGALGGVDLQVGVDAALEAERRVGVQAEALGRLAHPYGIEVGALDEDVGRRLADARIEAAEDAGDAHRTLGRADHQVLVRELALHAVERHERRALGAGADHHLAALDLCGIEGVQRLSELEEHEVGDVDQVVLGVNARGPQAVLHPLGRGADLAARDRDAHVAGAGLVVFDADRHGQVVVVHGKGRDVGPLHLRPLAAATEVGRQVARHADVRGGIHPVGRQADLDQVVVLDAEVLPGRHADGRVGRKLHDALVRGADAQLVLGAEHAERLDAADLRPLDLELLVAAVGVEHRADRGAEHLQSRTAVGRTADDLQRFARADIDRRDVQVVRVGMVRAGHDLADHHAPKAALDGLDLLEALDLESYVGQNTGHLLGRKVRFDVAFEPVVGNIHIVEFMYLLKSNKDSEFSALYPPLRRESAHSARTRAEGMPCRQRDPSQRKTMPTRMKARSTAFERRLRSWKSTAPHRNEMTTEPRRIIETTEIIASSCCRASR